MNQFMVRRIVCNQGSVGREERVGVGFEGRVTPGRSPVGVIEKAILDVHQEQGGLHSFPKVN